MLERRAVFSIVQGVGAKPQDLVLGLGVCKVLTIYPEWADSRRKRWSFRQWSRSATSQRDHRRQDFWQLLTYSTRLEVCTRISSRCSTGNRTTRRQIISRSVNSRTGQLAD